MSRGLHEVLELDAKRLFGGITVLLNLSIVYGSYRSMLRSTLHVLAIFSVWVLEGCRVLSGVLSCASAVKGTWS